MNARHTHWKWIIVIGLLVLALASCSPAATQETVIVTAGPVITETAIPPTATATATNNPTSTATPELLFRTIDGDTVEVIPVGGEPYTVRLLGIDTPEEGQPGYDGATEANRAWIRVGLVLVVDSGKLDKYGRHLAYLQRSDGSDLGLFLIEGGFAIARYDGLDGYGIHPLQDIYRAASPATAVPEPTDTAIPRPTVRIPATVGPSEIYYANCAAAKAAGAAPLYAGEPGYRTALDRDKDGVACES